MGRPIPNKEVEERRAKGLCFWCDEKFTPGHKCAKKLYNLEVRIGELTDSEEQEETDNMELDQPAEENEEEEPLISIHALTGEPAHQTLKAVGKVGKHQFLILVDSGSSHNFLDSDLASKLHCELQEVKLFGLLWLMVKPYMEPRVVRSSRGACKMRSSKQIL